MHGLSVTSTSSHLTSLLQLALLLVALPCTCGACSVQALRALGVSIVTSTKVTAVQQAAVYTPVDPQDSVAVAAAASGASLPAEQPAGAGTPGSAKSGTGSNESSSSYTTPSYTYGSSSSQPSYVVQLEPVSAYSSTAGSQLPADLVIWTAGSKPASQPLQPFPCDSRGQLDCDPTLRVPGHSRVFALGDVSKGYPEQHSGSGGSTTTFHPATAQVAFQQADYAAWNVWSAINNRPLLPFRYV